MRLFWPAKLRNSFAKIYAHIKQKAKLWSCREYISVRRLMFQDMRHGDKNWSSWHKNSTNLIDCQWLNKCHSHNFVTFLKDLLVLVVSGFYHENWWQGVTQIVINILKPTGHVIHQQFNIQQLYALPTLYLCVLYLSENKQRLVPLTAWSDWFL